MSNFSPKEKLDSDRAAALNLLGFGVWFVTLALLVVIILLSKIDFDGNQSRITLAFLFIPILLSVILSTSGAFTELINSWYPDSLLTETTKKPMPKEPITTIPLIG